MCSINTKSIISAMAIGLALIAAPAMAEPPPKGWLQFCADHPDDCRAGHMAARMKLTKALHDRLDRINRRINAQIAYRSDGKGHDTWRYPDDGFGDCEDYALAKRRALIAAGIPQATLALAEVRDTRTGGLHVILLFHYQNGALALDNNYRDAMRVEDIVGPGEYRFLAVQDRAEPNVWHRINWPMF